MDLKDILEPQGLKAIREMNDKMTALSKGLSLSPVTEYMRQMEEQRKLFHGQFSGISQALSISMPSHMRAIDEITKGITPFVDQITKMHSPYQELMKQIQEQTRPFQEALKQFHALQDQLNFSEISKAFRGVTDFIRSIPPEHLIKVRLHSEHWLIGDDELLALVIEEDLHDNEEIIPFVIGYYKANGWHRLNTIVGEWQADIEPGRLKVFQAAIAMSKDADHEDVHLLTVPALIAQIDGLVRDLYGILPKLTRKRVEQEIKDNLPAELKGKRTDVRHDVAVQTVAEIVDFWSAEMLQEVIFSGLFRDSNKITPDDSYSLFRHKIMHGDKEYLAYGNEENFIRLMLYAEFIIKLIKQIKDGSMTIEQAA
ncbi:hypothetical protein [Micavibrio aeruginosavorus]|uniref:Uncharacterized protein n=1 Tax=Micavibrio aeruginosavorus EPB TaxID=349215 RepID=M4VID6_9BACT|nr:hypothetical protein [Micavibrio aeruginosavorus]AGH98958.1 hypothetical protein A11S_2160 [Micavibrio aeruginosavorus EPB]